jgi:hypothetical protein
MTEPEPDHPRHIAIFAASLAALLIAASPASAASAPRSFFACTDEGALLGTLFGWAQGGLKLDGLGATGRAWWSGYYAGSDCTIVWKGTRIDVFNDPPFVNLRVADNPTVYVALITDAQ